MALHPNFPKSPHAILDPAVRWPSSSITEAVETIVYLDGVAGVKDKYDMMRFDSSRAVSPGMWCEDINRIPSDVKYDFVSILSKTANKTSTRRRNGATKTNYVKGFFAAAESLRRWEENPYPHFQGPGSGW